MPNFKKRVIDIVYTIPKGKVASYGQIALMAGYPRGARAVGWILHGLGKNKEIDLMDFPWWRAVNNRGILSIKGHTMDARSIQKAKLEADGVKVGDDFTFNIEQYRFTPIIIEYEN